MIKYRIFCDMNDIIHIDVTEDMPPNLYICPRYSNEGVYLYCLKTGKSLMFNLRIPFSWKTGISRNNYIPVDSAFYRVMAKTFPNNYIIPVTWGPKDANVEIDGWGFE